MQLEGRVVVITGGGRGIGRAIAQRFYDEGARVAIASRNSKDLQTVSMEMNKGDHRIVPFRCDVTDRDEVEVLFGNVVEVWDRVDILVNNAGLSGITPAISDRPDDDSEARWRDILAVNLTGAWSCVREALPHMPEDGRGRILNLSSVLGKFGVPGYAAYCSAKHGIIGFTRSVALEVVGRGITVNAICPGWVETEMASQGIEESAAFEGITPEAFRKRAVEMVPIKRFLDADEVAGLVLYLVSEKAAGITGQAINICGGQTMV
jgi:NAD(P)-dependent dehydrogenase (short-subunit alcohol dehydrogenase family)